MVKNTVGYGSKTRKLSDQCVFGRVKSMDDIYTRKDIGTKD